jgi:hypothetical protein
MTVRVGRPSTRLLSAHQICIGEALATADFAGRRPARVAAVGMVPDCLDTGFGLSPLIGARLPLLVCAALTTLTGWGVPVPTKEV